VGGSQKRALDWEAFVVATFNDQELEIEKREYYNRQRNRSGVLDMRLRRGGIVIAGVIREVSSTKN